ncbi:MAG: response regulator [Myxococcota bacterium]
MEQTSGTPKLILLIEDDIELAELTQTVLFDEGYVVLHAGDGRRALAVLDALLPVSPAVVIADMVMPVLDGLGFLREYAARPSPRPPVLAVSAVAPYLREARKLGATASLEKPYMLGQLLAAVRQLVTGGSVAVTPPRKITDEEERRRLRALFDLRLDQPAPEEALRAFVDHVARVFEVPVCLISVVTESRQFWTAGCGVPEVLAVERGTVREQSFCTHAVVGRTALVVQDAADNPFFYDNLLVWKHGVRLYAGVPLMSRTGEAVGTLCVMDFKPRIFTHFDLELLSVLARRVLAELEWREKRARPEVPASAFRYLNYVDAELGVLGRAAFLDVLTVEAARLAQKRRALALVGVWVPQTELVGAARALEKRFDTGWVGRLCRNQLAVICSGMTAQEAQAAAQAVLPRSARLVAQRAPSAPVVVETMLRDVESRLTE